MAFFTAATGIIFFTYIRQMYILMTIFAFNPYIPEAPFILFPVAFIAGDCLMGIP